jgi:hydroxylaminobenzene mutase
METNVAAEHHAQRLIRAGAILLPAGLLIGIAIPHFAVPRLALSAHVLAIMQATLLMVLGLVWQKLRLTPGQSRLSSWLAIYGFYGAWLATLLAGLWGAGNSMLPMSAGGARGSVSQELVIRVLLMSAALSQIAVAAMVLWGLRGNPVQNDEKSRLSPEP